jgi:hypothetical protein
MPCRAPQCLGSYVFHWAQHHEKTHTWYGMFLEDGSRTEAVDVMTYLWSGRWPANRSPRLGARAIQIGTENGDAAGPAVLPPGAILHCHLDASDPDGDALRYSWDLRLDVSRRPQGRRRQRGAHSSHRRPGPRRQGNHATFRLPEAEGVYRLFAYVRDGHGNAATANFPLRVAEAHVSRRRPGSERFQVWRRHPAHDDAARHEYAGAAQCRAHFVLRPVAHQAGVDTDGRRRAASAFPIRRHYVRQPRDRRLCLQHPEAHAAARRLSRSIPT